MPGAVYVNFFARSKKMMEYLKIIKEIFTLWPETNNFLKKKKEKKR